MAENDPQWPYKDHFMEGSKIFFSQPVADLPIQPLVGLLNPKTPLIPKNLGFGISAHLMSGG